MVSCTAGWAGVTQYAHILPGLSCVCPEVVMYGGKLYSPLGVIQYVDVLPGLGYVGSEVLMYGGMLYSGLEVVQYVDVLPD